MRFFLALILFSWANVWAQDSGSTKVSVPALTSPVVDQAQLLSQAEQRDLSELAYEIHANNGPQITILTVPDLQGFAIEDFSIAVTEQWQLGTKKAGNGLLVLVSKNDRQMRIEVGEGIEGEITDYDTAKYTRDIFPRYFREGNFHAAFRLLMEDVAGKFNIKLQEGGSTIVRRAPRPHVSSAFEKMLPFLVIVLVLGHLILRRRPGARGAFTGAGMAGVGWLMLPGIGMGLIALFILGFIFGLAGINNILYYMAMSRGGYRGGGFGGGGFGGGGGWGGGGGGFSGGGSSGSW